MSAKAYTHASGVLPPKLLNKVMQALAGKITKIVFAEPGARPNKSEGQIPDDLVEKCRRWVDAKVDSDGISRTLYFGTRTTYKRLGKPAYAYFLSKAGVSIGAVQAALGITYPTAVKYGAKASNPQLDITALDPQVYKTYKAAGEKRCEEVGIERTHGREEFMIHVGAALELINTRSEKWDAKLAKAADAT